MAHRFARGLVESIEAAAGFDEDILDLALLVDAHAQHHAALLARALGDGGVGGRRIVEVGEVGARRLERRGRSRPAPGRERA